MITLAELRSKNNLTQKELAEGLGVSISSIAMYEIGARIPSLKKAKQIAGYFKVPIEEINFFNQSAHATGANSKTTA